MTTTAQFAVKATYYGLARTSDAIVLIAHWMDDETGATVWTELDREHGQEESSWTAIRTRNTHLLAVEQVA